MWKFNHKSKLFETSIFFQHSEKIRKIIDILNKNRITIINGIHNTGKWSIVNELIKKIWREKNVFYFEKTYDINNSIKTWEDLKRIFLEELHENKDIKIIVLKKFNKIEKIKDFLNFVYSHNNKFKIILISNTVQISNCKEVTMYPENVDNIMNYYQLDDNLMYGTFPEVLLLWHNHFRRKHLQLMLNDIFTKDIFYSFWVKSIYEYDYFIKYLSRENSFFSLRELHKCLSENIQISLKTTIDYVNFSSKSKIIHPVFPFDFKKEKHISTKSKYYFTDTGMRNCLNHFELSEEIRKENFLFQQLLSHEYTIYSWINGTFQFTFYITNESENICIQFGNIREKNELKKEINKLNKIPVAWKKYLILENSYDLNIRKLHYDDVEIITYKTLINKLFFTKKT